MFTPINRLPGHDISLRSKFEERWQTQEGRAARDLVLGLIREGAGEDFLQSDFECGRLSLLEDMWDLRGFQIQGETLRFPDNDTFEAIDFSYGAFWNTTFENAVFQSGMRFGRVSGCTFIRCTFIYGHFFATWFGNSRFVECDFIDSCGFTNCDFTNVHFESCYLGVSILTDCRFDTVCSVGPLTENSHRSKRTRDLRLQADIYLGISDAYQAGRVSASRRKYLFLALQSTTRYNTVGVNRLLGFVKEYLFGHSLRPGRVLLSLLTLLLFGSVWFTTAMPVREAILFAAGALFTFGIHADKLDSLSTSYSIVYVFLAFAGISLTALFAAVWARVFLAED
jgi:hypothetical protein